MKNFSCLIKHDYFIHYHKQAGTSSISFNEIKGDFMEEAKIDKLIKVLLIIVVLGVIGVFLIPRIL